MFKFVKMDRSCTLQEEGKNDDVCAYLMIWLCMTHKGSHLNHAAAIISNSLGVGSMLSNTCTN